MYHRGSGFGDWRNMLEVYVSRKVLCLNCIRSAIYSDKVELSLELRIALSGFLLKSGKCLNIKRYIRGIFHCRFKPCHCIIMYLKNNFAILYH